MRNGSYWRPVMGLSLIMTCRMLGLFMLMPVFALVAPTLSGSTPFLVGAVLAAYGLTQATFQIPFGYLSDRWGRRPVIAMGLVLFALGSVVAALAHSIIWVLVGRAIQGAGAVGSTVLATVADFTPNESRSKAMAVLGLGIGIAFALAMVLGPIVMHALGLSGLFLAMSGLAVLGLLVLWFVIPQPPQIKHDSVLSASGHWGDILRMPQLLKLDISIFMQHAILTALFLALPLVLAHHMQLSTHQQSIFYLVIFGLAFVLMVPGVIVAEKHRKMKLVFVLSVALMCVCLGVLAGFSLGFVAVAVVLLLFFTAFTLMESILPSCVSKVAPLKYRGSAMGVYSTSQFLGICVGGLLGGWALHAHAITGVWMLCAGLALLWLLVALTLEPMAHFSTLIFSLHAAAADKEQAITNRLLYTDGIYEVAWQAQSGRLYLKVDKRKVDEATIRQLIGEGNLG